MTESLVVAVDQGTSSTKCLVAGEDGRVVSRASAPVGMTHPAPGWVEQSADDIWSSVVRATAEALAGHDASRVAALGLSTQRESIVLWERSSGRALGPVIGWQDQRASAACSKLRAEGHAPLVRDISGVPLDAMFSAAKARWLLDETDPDRSRSRRGELCLGTVDSWLIWQLTGQHRIEVGNASRTQLFDVRKRDWSPQLLELFDVPVEVLPEVVPSAGSFGAVRGLAGLTGVPLSGVLADSHAALFAHGARRAGLVKATVGTGSSVIGLVDSPDEVTADMCLTIAWDDGLPTYAAEGNIRATGAAIVWAATLLGTTPAGLIALAADTSSAGVDVVPAFGGLAAPWWDDNAVGLVTGLTLSTGPGEFARAIVESVALQIADVTAVIDRCSRPVECLYVDGGGSASDLLMQLQADFAQVSVRRARTIDLSALGAAHLAGRVVGVWDDESLAGLPREFDVFDPQLSTAAVDERRRRWHSAIDRARVRAQA